MAARKKTVGVSPKAPAAGVVSAVAVLVAWAALELFDTKLDVNAVQAVIAAVVAALGAFGGAYRARPGTVVAERTTRGRAVRKEAGYGLVELLVAVILVVLLIWLVAAVVD